MVQIALAGAADLATTVDVLLDEVHALEGLHGLADDRARSVAMTGRADTVVLAATVVDGQSTDTGTRAHVQVTRNGGYRGEKIKCEGEK